MGSSGCGLEGFHEIVINCGTWECGEEGWPGIFVVVGKPSDPMCNAQCHIERTRGHLLELQWCTFVVLVIYKWLQNPMLYTSWVNHLDEIKAKLYLLWGWFISLGWWYNKHSSFHLLNSNHHPDWSHSNSQLWPLSRLWCCQVISLCPVVLHSGCH